MATHCPHSSYAYTSISLSGFCDCFYNNSNYCGRKTIKRNTKLTKVERKWFLLKLSVQLVSFWNSMLQRRRQMLARNSKNLWRIFFNKKNLRSTGSIEKRVFFCFNWTLVSLWARVVLFVHSNRLHRNARFSKTTTTTTTTSYQTVTNSIFLAVFFCKKLVWANLFTRNCWILTHFLPENFPDFFSGFQFEFFLIICCVERFTIRFASIRSDPIGRVRFVYFPLLCWLCTPWTHSTRAIIFILFPKTIRCCFGVSNTFNFTIFRWHQKKSET